jgi:hypothetical protein
MCLPRGSIATILQVAHDSKVGAHFGLAKTMSRLSRDFIDPAGTITEALQAYVQEHNLDLPLTRTSMKGGGELRNNLCLARRHGTGEIKSVV